MGIRAYVQVKQPEYGRHCLSSWVYAQAAQFLRDNDVGLYDNDGCGDHWEIEITDALEELAAKLSANPEIFDDTLDEELRGGQYGKQLAGILNEGLGAAKCVGYGTIEIDWFKPHKED